jgi:signal transduction histidine kinase
MRTLSGRWAKRHSLEAKLPLLITALLLGVVVAIVAASYREVRRSAITSATDRLSMVAEQLAAIAAESVVRRMAVLAGVAADPVLADYLETGTAAAQERAVSVLEQLRVAADTALPLQLWSAARQPVLEANTGRAEEPSLYLEWQTVGATAPDSGYGSLFHLRGRSYFWVVSPVRVKGEVLGYVAQVRSIAAANPERILQLLGEDLELMYANASGGEWVTLHGEPLPAPRGFRGAGPSEYARPGELPRLGHAAAIAGTPFVLVAEVPKDVVLARPHEFLRWMLVIASVLIVLGALLARVLGRSVTRPLAQLTAATGEIAAGRYGQRVHLDRADELGGLADRFNDMATQVETAHEQLERQVAEARTLANEVAHANMQLTEAMAAAEHARNQAQKASRAKSEFLATMSHEMRTPINAMIGYADLLEIGVAGPLNERQRGQLARIRASGKHLIGLVDEILDLAGIESGHLRLDAATARISDAAQTALAIVQPQAEGKGVALGSACVCPTACTYTGDPRRVEQILLNLLSNAVKFTPAGGRIELHCREVVDPDGRWVEATVHDTGVGIPEDQLERVFEPFVQVDAGYTRAHGGVGLGLAISRRLARMMGGEVTAHSTTGRGSRFTLRLPAGAAAPARTKVDRTAVSR